MIKLKDNSRFKGSMRRRGETEMKTVKRMMDHMNWADGRILDALEKSETKNKELLKLFGT
ncbi:hypothetical protein [Paenibacillus konkukensis]|nr:hypothetical protein [Paenibacillus konkukensis]